MAPVRVLGAGPAGNAAALAALALGAEVEIYEKTPFPRHKVCGEFISPDGVRLLDQLGLLSAFEERRPAKMRRMRLVFGRAEKASNLREMAFGLSRRELDALMLDAVQRKGGKLVRSAASPVDGGATVLAWGRMAIAPRGQRLFGFKTHYAGPVDDAVELFFLDKNAYVGVSPVENATTNVCGLADEATLRQVNFDIDEYLFRHPVLKDRLGALRRTMDWMTVGPLVFQNQLDDSVQQPPLIYPAGDSLSFVDPFTGSGILSALLTGRLAGTAAASGLEPSAYLAQCRRALRRPFATARFFHRAVAAGWGQVVAPWIPGPLLFRLTRPKI